jgi:ABC-type transport system involved in cytochrome bd biosynthesis fused ATPase/permease subunit
MLFAVFAILLLLGCATTVGKPYKHRKRRLELVILCLAAAMAAAVCAMLISAWIVEGAPEIMPLIIFAVATVTALWLAFRIYRSVQA